MGKWWQNMVRLLRPVQFQPQSDCRISSTGLGSGRTVWSVCITESRIVPAESMMNLATSGSVHESSPLNTAKSRPRLRYLLRSTSERSKRTPNKSATRLPGSLRRSNVSFLSLRIPRLYSGNCGETATMDASRDATSEKICCRASSSAVQNGHQTPR